MQMKKSVAVGLMGLAGIAGAADYTWLTSPSSADWLGAANWMSGAWVADVSNTATFGASSQTDVNVNGAVTVAGMNVMSGAYTFSNGTLMINGPVDVAAGASATVASKVNSTIAGTTTDKRFVKTGAGTLTLKGDASTTNSFAKFAVRGGTFVLDGGTHLVTEASTGVGETTVAGSFANSSALEIKGGAQLIFSSASATTRFLSNSGCDIVVSDGLFDAWNFGEFLNGFNDNNGTDKSSVARVTVRDKGVFKARMFRPGARGTAAGSLPDYGVLNLSSGGVMQVGYFHMEKNRFATLNADGGALEFVGSGDAGKRFGNGDADTAWALATLNILEGGLSISSRDAVAYLLKGFTSGAAHDGGLTIKGPANAIYLYGTNTYTGATRLTESALLSIRDDVNLGAKPQEPTTNLIVTSSSSALHASQTVDVHANRDIWVEKDVTLQLGAASEKTLRIHGAISGPENGVSCRLAVSEAWPGVVALHPDNERTNYIGRLRVRGRLNVESGTTLLTSNTTSKVDENCGFYVARADGQNAFSDTKGILTITGGRVVVPHSMYAELKSGGQVYVNGGTLDVSATKEWMNGLNGTGRTVIQGTGEMIANIVRLTQVSARDANGEPLSTVQVKTGGVLRLNRFYRDIDGDFTTRVGWCGTLLMDGGTLVARRSETEFFGTADPRWTNNFFRVVAGGARVDTADNDVSIYNPVLSGADKDGGFTKLGAGTLTLQGVNTYNGTTRVEGGTLVFSNERGYPGGNLDFPAATLAERTDRATPLVTMAALNFRSGCKVRVVESTEAAEKAMRGRQVVATFTETLTSLPELEVLDAEGSVCAGSPWRLSSANGGKALTISYARGTAVLVR